MEFLFSNLPPLKTSCPTFVDMFYSLMHEATRLDIAVGYITAASLAELKQTVAYNENIETLNLIIGMHRWEKFTKPEYDAAIGLNNFLRTENRGEVRIVTPFRFHGKLYSYSNQQGAFAGIIGSNNLGSIVESRTRTYEVSSLFREIQYATEMRKFIDKLSATSTDNLSDCEITEFKHNNPLLEGHEGVNKLPPEDLVNIKRLLTNIQFSLPLNKRRGVPGKSDLNCYFGEGRRQSNGMIRPRPWYESEVKVPTTITSNPNYPLRETRFEVITDDGWKFACIVNGGDDGKKNLRSADDLTILGKWLKGRLENAGVLQVGNVVNEQTLNDYGRSDILLTKTTIPNLWYLDFGVNL